MCSDPKDGRLERFAICSCFAWFPECDLEDAKGHINLKPGVSNHKWVYVHKNWIEVLEFRPPTA